MYQSLVIGFFICLYQIKNVYYIISNWSKYDYSYINRELSEFGSVFASNLIIKTIYMIKRERTKKSKIELNPYMYYMTNWGFMETEITEDRPVESKKENEKLEK